MVTRSKGATGACTVLSVIQACEMLHEGQCWQSVMRWRWQCHGVTGSWLFPWLEPGFVVPGPSGADLDLFVAVLESHFTLQAAFHANNMLEITASCNNSSPKLWRKMFCAGAMRFLLAGSKRVCVPQVWDKTVGVGSILPATLYFRP